jgi:hypothetical protein
MPDPDAQLDQAIAAATGLPPVPALQTDAESLATGMQAPSPPELQPPKSLPPESPPKGPAEWACARLVHYIRQFEQGLDAAQEIAMGFAGSDAGLLRIEGLGFSEPDLLTFYGREEDGTKTQLIQHVSQLNFHLRAVPTATPEEPARRIGFHLVSGWRGGEAGDGSATDLAADKA